MDLHSTLDQGADGLEQLQIAPVDVRPWVGDQYRRRGHGQYRSASDTVDSMLARLDAPKTIDSIRGMEASHSIASAGGTAPEANTDIAIARNRRVCKASAYASIPPDILNPILLMFAHTIGLSTPARSSASRSRGRFMVMKPGSAPY